MNKQFLANFSCFFSFSELHFLLNQAGKLNVSPQQGICANNIQSFLLTVDCKGGLECLRDASSYLLITKCNLTFVFTLTAL